MTSFLTFGATLLSMLVLDGIWLFGIAKSFYMRELGTLARTTSPNLSELLSGIFVYILMGALLATGIVMAVKGTLWVLPVMLVVFVFAFAKIGCLH